MTTEQTHVPIWKREPNLYVSIAMIALSILLVFYGAYRMGFLPIQPPSEFEVRLGQLARQSHGDFNKLSKEEQDELNKHTTGRGAMAMGM